jgi:hypothetical protein
MAGTDPEEVVRRYIAAKDNHDVEAVVALLDPDFTSYDPDVPEPVKGIEAVRPFFVMLESVDMKTRIISMMSKDNVVAAELEVTCAFKQPGEFVGQDIPAAGQPFVVRFAKFYRVNSKGLLTEEREYDSADKLQALGAKAAAMFQALGAKA